MNETLKIFGWIYVKRTCNAHTLDTNHASSSFCSQNVLTQIIQQKKKRKHKVAICYVKSGDITLRLSWLFPAETGTEGAGICGSELWEGHGTGRLVITFHCSPWGQSERRGHRRHDDKTRRRGITQSAGAALLPRILQPDAGTQSAKRHERSASVKYHYGFVRWEGNRRMFVVYRLVSTDCMCGLDLSGFLYMARPERKEKHICQLVGVLSPTEPTFKKTLLFSPSQRVGLHGFPVKTRTVELLASYMLHMCAPLHLVVELRETFSSFDIYMRLIKLHSLFSHVQSGVTWLH